MNIIPLKSVPRQKFSLVLDSAHFEISLTAISGCMYATIVRDDIPIISGVRCMPNKKIIPYKYLEGKAGNFAFYTGGEYPWYENFGVDQVLYYANVSEIEAARE